MGENENCGAGPGQWLPGSSSPAALGAPGGALSSSKEGSIEVLVLGGAMPISFGVVLWLSYFTRPAPYVSM